MPNDDLGSRGGAPTCMRDADLTSARFWDRFSRSLRACSSRAFLSCCSRLDAPPSATLVLETDLKSPSKKPGMPGILLDGPSEDRDTRTPFASRGRPKRSTPRSLPGNRKVAALPRASI